MSEFRNLEWLDATHGSETFATDLIKVEDYGSFVRLTFGVPDQSANCPGEPPMLSVVAKLVVPADALTDMLEKLANPTVVRAKTGELRRLLF